MVWPTFNILVKATHNSVSEMCRYFIPVVKTSAASTSSDVTARTSEAPAANVNVTAPSTNTAPKLSPHSADTAKPDAVSSSNVNAPSQPVLTSCPRRAFSGMEK